MVLISGVPLGISGVFYVLFGLWWHLQVTKKFWSACSQKTTFISTATYPCCSRIRKCSVEGMLKAAGSVTVCGLCIVWLSQTEEKTQQNEAIGQLTVFIMFLCSGVCDILIQSCQKFIFQKLDYLVLLFCFNLQSIVLAYHTENKDSWTALADTYAMFASTCVAVALLLELKFPGYIWCVLLRIYCTVLLGTWLIHMIVYFSSKHSNHDVTANGSTSAQYRNLTQQVNLFQQEQIAQELEDVLWVPMYFVWHCICDLILLTVMWLVTYKCASRNCCFCVPGDEERVSHFENRVHFDYHVISTMTDSDFE